MSIRILYRLVVTLLHNTGRSIKMSFSINVEHSKVILEFFPETSGPDNYLDLLEEREFMCVYNTFSISKENVLGVDGDYVKFSIGYVDGQYNRITADVLRTKRDYCFEKSISLARLNFVGTRKTSILGMLDKFISSESNVVYIDSKSDDISSDNHIPYSAFLKFRKSIPHDAELAKYILMRAATVFSGIFPNADSAIEKHNKWLMSVEKNIQRETPLINNIAKLDYLHSLDYKKLVEIRGKLKYYIDNCDLYDESTYQEVIAEIVRFIFPKYLYAVREVRFSGIDSYDKQPDFVLIDYNGMIDFMEIKKPSVKIINIRTYRNNFSPSHELSGAAQQVEKYIACVQRCAEEWENSAPKKIAQVVPNKLKLKILNPQGIIIMGNASDLSLNQRKDFELIKRQYKHVTEIITYDDLLGRLDNMILSLKPYETQLDLTYKEI